MKCISIAALLCLAICGATAQPLRWVEGTDAMNIAAEVAVYEDTTGQLAIGEIAAPGRGFVRNEKNVIDFKLVHSQIWVRFELDNPANTPLTLELGQALLPVVNLYYRDARGNWVKERSGYTVNLYHKPTPYNLPIFALPAGVRTFYLNFQANSTPVPLKLWDRVAHKTKRPQQIVVYGVYMGLIGCVVLINLMLFFFFRHRVYLHYVLLIFMYGSFSAIFEGYLSFFLPEANLVRWFILNPVINQIIGLSYCFAFLEIEKYAPRLHRWVRPILICALVYFGIHLFLPVEIVIPLNQFTALIAIFIEVGFGIGVGRKGNRQGYPYALTYFIFFIFCAVEVIYLQTGRPGYVFYMSHVSLGILFEVLALSYLLVKRFQWERTELQDSRALAQQRFLEKTQENERIVREQNLLLEREVTRRTQQLRRANDELNRSLETVEQERQGSEKLLLNILPVTAARELKEKGSTTPQVYPAVTVLFTDFKDFTSTTAAMPPEQLVNDLHHCFSAFDRIMQHHGIEKIKTIGDAYLAASGLPLANEEHAANAVRAALDIQAFMRQWTAEQARIGQEGWVVRIGIHTGPVVAGVVGTHKFAYDIWGDTVNTAARLESSSAPGRINISKATYVLVQDLFTCTRRGAVEVKGKGALEMFWVEGVLPVNGAGVAAGVAVEKEG